MLYPVVSMQPGLDATRSARELSTQRDYRDAYSVEKHLRAGMPPLFVAQSVDDPIVDIRHSLTLYQAALQAKLPMELHAFETGGHSWGLGAVGSEVGQWPGLFANWLRRHRLLGPSSTARMATPGATPAAVAPQDPASDDPPAEDEGD